MPVRSSSASNALANPADAQVASLSALFFLGLGIATAAFSLLFRTGVDPAFSIVAACLFMAIIAIGVFARPATPTATVEALRRHRPFLLAGPAALGFASIVWINGDNMAHLYAPELAALGRQHIDTLYHAAIAEMLRQHGVASTGLDGLVPGLYHVGSHAAIAALAGLLGRPAIQIYAVVLPVLAVPLLLFGYVRAVLALGRRAAADGPMTLPAPVVILLPIGLLLLTELFTWDSYVRSESYAFAMLLFLLGLPGLLGMVMAPAGPGFAGLAADWRRWLPLLALAPPLVAIKISVGILWAGMVGYALLRVYLLGPSRHGAAILTGLALAGLAALLGVGQAILPGGVGPILAPFRFPLEYPDQFVASLVPVAAAVLWLRRLARPLLPNQRRVVELLLVATAAAHLPGLLFSLTSAPYYFVNVPAWFALVVLSVVALRRLAILPEGGRVTAGRVLLILFVLAAADPTKWRRAATFIDTIATLQAVGEGRMPAAPGKRALGETLAVAAERLPGVVAYAWAEGALFGPAVGDAIADSPGGQFLALVEAAKAEAGGRLVLHVPPSNRSFWRLNPDCRAQPFFLPALTGVPMLMGLPPADVGCAIDDSYGYSDYGPGSVSVEATAADLCARAVARGFDIILILREPGSVPASDRLRC